MSVSDACTIWGQTPLLQGLLLFIINLKSFSFLLAENVVLCKASSFSNALFMMFASYPVFYI